MLTGLRIRCGKLLVLLWAAQLSACGGGNDAAEPAPPPAATAVPAGQTVQQSLGAAGGDVVLASSDGASFTLSLPAGALGKTTAVSLNTAAATPAQHFHLRLLPQGLVLADGKVATLTLSLPATAALPARGGLLYDGVPVAFTRLPDGRLQVQLTRFAGAAAAAASAAPTSGRARALAARVLADTPTPARCAPALGGLAEDGGLTAADAVEIEIYGQCMVAAVNELAANAQYAAAVRLASATAAFLQAVGQGNDLGFVTQAGTIACVAYRQARSTALDTPITGMGSLYAVLKPVLFWAAALQRLAHRCPDLAEGDYIELTNTKTAEAAAYYTSRQGSIVTTDGVAYTEAAREAVAAHTTVTEVRSLQPPPALNTLLTTAIEQTAQPSLLDVMLQAPWQRCRDSGDRSELLRLWEVMNKAQAVKQALQYCATQITAVAKDGNGDVKATLSPALGGVSASQRHTRGTLSVGADQSIELGGSIGVLSCPEAGSEQLQVSFKGVQVATLDSSAGVLLGAGHTLPVLSAASLRQAAGLAADDSGQHELVIRRKGSACAALLEIEDEVLATVVVDFGRPSFTVERIDIVQLFLTNQAVPEGRPTLPLIWSSQGASGTATVRLEFRDPKTLVASGDFAINGLGDFVIVMSLRFERAGILTVSMAADDWMQGAICNAQQIAGGSTFTTTSTFPVHVGMSPCPGSYGPRGPQTLSVSAGMSLQIVEKLTSQDSAFTAHGDYSTLHFEPAP